MKSSLLNHKEDNLKGLAMFSSDQIKTILTEWNNAWNAHDLLSSIFEMEKSATSLRIVRRRLKLKVNGSNSS
jgi:hypothetical protein